MRIASDLCLPYRQIHCPKVFAGALVISLAQWTLLVVTDRPLLDTYLHQRYMIVLQQLGFG